MGLLQEEFYDSLFHKLQSLCGQLFISLCGNIFLKLRYGVSAQTAPSIVYDYYNPEAQATLAPLKFNVK